MKSPCLDCPSRVALCHASCAGYKSFKAALNAQNAARAARRSQADGVLMVGAMRVMKVNGRGVPRSM